MEFAVVVHEEPTGGFWAEVPALPGCYSQGETLDEIEANIKEAIEGVLAVKAGEVEDVVRVMVVDIPAIR